MRQDIVKQLRTNQAIRAREVLVISETEERLGVMTMPEALRVARERGFDLVEVAPTAVPPVCRLLDYGKYRYEQTKKERQARKSQRTALLREVRLRPKIDEHDLLDKIRLAKRLIEEGDKVKISVRFRGREVTHPEIGRSLLQKVATELKGVAGVESPPNMDGRQLVIVLMPLPSRRAKEAKTTKETDAQT